MNPVYRRTHNLITLAVLFFGFVVQSLGYSKIDFKNLGYSDTLSYAHDVSTVQHILDAYYDCISGPIGQKRDFERLKNLFHPEARLIYSHWNEDVSEASLMVFNSIDEFIPKLDYLDKKGFYEHEISNVIHSFSSVTQVFSVYRFEMEDKTAEGQGITSYELYYDGSRYWILSMFWTAENKEYIIPETYLKK